MAKVIITAEEANALVGKPNVVFLDCSFDKEGKINYAEEFPKEHISGSHYFDFKKGVPPHEFIPLDLPDAPTFESYVKSFGINSDTLVVVYEKIPDAGGFLFASRVWFMFSYFGHDNVRILEGGLTRWKNLNLPVTDASTPVPQTGNFTVNERENKRIHHDEVKALIANNSVQILDARPPPMFQKGTLPNAINVPVGSFIKRDTMTMPSPDEILAMVKAKGVDVTKPIVTSCNSGNAASGLSSILAAAGIESRVFVGSYTEWIKRQAKE